MFFDIEVDTGKDRVFPTPLLAKYPINMISTIYNGRKVSFIVDNKTEPIVPEGKEGFELRIFDKERSMMLDFIKYFKECDPDFIAGWNCISENELVFSNNRIIKIKNLTEGEKLKNHGKVLKHKCTGIKEEYEIKLTNGSKVRCSIDHVFPFFIKEKDRYVSDNILVKNKFDMKIRDIMSYFSDNDVYLRIDLGRNRNNNYTWRNYIKDNFDRIMQFEEIDIKIIDKRLRDKIKSLGIHKSLKRQEYWQGSEFFRNSFWSYKNLKEFINKEEIIDQLDKYDKQYFKIGKNYNLEIEINKDIKNEDLKLLGFLYTDGFWSTYDNTFNFSNKNYDNIYKYNGSMNEFRRFPFYDIKNKYSKRDQLYYLNFGFTNRFTILMPLIYGPHRKKILNCEALSCLSEEQFSSFFSGLIDGDGSTKRSEIRIYCHENEGRDCEKLYTLLTWNGVFSNIIENSVAIPRIDFNAHIFSKINSNHSERKKFCNSENLRTPKNSKSKLLKKFFFEDYVLVRISSISKTNKKVKMYDIETETNYFICNGIETHNCINFDLEYIYNRLPKIGIKANSMTRFNEFYVDGERFICHMPGCNAMDQTFLYQTFTFTKKENYKLGFIAQEELGETKIQLPLPFNEMYWKMLNTTINYNIRDTALLEKLENKLNHINLLNELRIVCNTSFEATSSFGQIDSIMVSYLKDKGLASKNGNPHIKKIEYPGAFVFEPIPGTYNDVVDFDFASLYPSIIITYNLGINNYVMKLVDDHLGYDLAYHPENLPENIEVIVDPTHHKNKLTVSKENLLKKIKDNYLIYTINGCFFKNHKKEMSVFSEVVDDLMKTRKKYKGKMFEAIENKDTDEEDYYYTRQLVYKVLANSLYGIVANKAFRFFDVNIAGAITLGGQEALKTSIIEGDAFMHHLKTGKAYEPPKELTKTEMYADHMPDRSNRYIVTGDTDSIFCCFGSFKGEKSVDQIRKWCVQIQDFLNQEKIVDIVKKHNVDPEFNRLELKNELVISRGLFLTKKRYAIRVINNEGKDVDKINYMGVEIKRSDYPSKSKDFMKQLSELILKSEKINMTQIMDFVEEQKKEFIHTIQDGDKSIARPVSFGKHLEDYKTIPQAVRAMLNWNNIMYEIHQTGSKAYMYRIKGIDPLIAPPDVMERYERYVGEGNKVDVIAIPDEEEKLPNYFIPDINSNLQFAFIDRYNLLLQPIMRKMKEETILTV
jgi:DNA polymerase elongation subunit (family B)